MTQPRDLTTDCSSQVHVAKSRTNPEDVVALKKIKLESDAESRLGFPITAIREIKILKALDDDNVVRLKDIVVTREDPENEGRDSVYMVFEYLDHDLEGLMSARPLWLSVPLDSGVARLFVCWVAAW